MSFAIDIAAASRVLSKSAARVFRTGSTSTNSAPAAVLLRYQNRLPSSSHCGRTESPEMSGDVFQDRSRSARVYVTCAKAAAGSSADDANARRSDSAGRRARTFEHHENLFRP